MTRIAVDAHRLVCEPNTSGATYLRGLLNRWLRSPNIALTLFIPHLPDRNNPHYDLLCETTAILPDTKSDPTASYRQQVWWNQILLPELLRRAHQDVFFCPFHLTPLWSWRTPIVTTIHDLCFLEERDVTLGRVVHQLQVTSAILRASALICISQYTHDVLTHYSRWAARKAVLIPNGIDRPLAERRQQGLEPYFLWVGTPCKRKNTELVVAAFALTCRRYPQHKLVLVAPTAFHDSLRALAGTHGVSASTTILGGLDSDALDALYRSATALVSPSSCEGFGYTVLEAAAQGCPPIVLRGGPGVEILGSSVRAANAATPAAIADLMMFYANLDPASLTNLVAELGRTALRYHSERTADLTLALLLKVAKEHQRV